MNANEYFKIFDIINQTVLPKIKDGRRISALLQNLEERRANNWKKHNVEAEGPKKLKYLLKEDEEPTQEDKIKADQAQLDDKMSKLLKKWVEGETKNANDELDALGRKYSPEELLGSYLKYFSDDKSTQIPKRLEVFNIIIDKYFGKTNFKDAWKVAFPNVALLSSEFPFCAAALAKILIVVNEKKGIKLTEFFIKFNEDEEEEEYYLMDEVFQKLWHYTQNE